jgi:osmotically-inducible protein OsmY
MPDENSPNTFGFDEASISRTDAQIVSDVVARINRNDLIQPKNIEVQVESGVVTLTGRVNGFSAIQEAEETAYEVLGVVDVQNYLESIG